jgi:hypothetical protein
MSVAMYPAPSHGGCQFSGIVPEGGRQGLSALAGLRWRHINGLYLQENIWDVRSYFTLKMYPKHLQFETLEQGK